MSQTFPATAFLRDPKGASRTASVTFDPGALRISAGDTEASWAYGSIQTRAAGDDHQYLLLTHSGDEGPFDSLIIKETAFFPVLAGRLTGSSHEFLLTFDPSRRKTQTLKWLTLVGAVMLGALFTAVAWWGITHWLVKEIVKRTPVATEVSWGETLVGVYLKGKKELKTGPAVEAANKTWKRLTDAAKPDNPGYPLILHVVDDPMVNAFALPGGHVVLMTGLMKKADSADEVAGVLAHETQHVLKRHVAARIAQSMGTRFLISAVFGGSNLEGLTLSAQQLGELSYGRGQETEADVEGANLMAKAGLSPAALGTFFKKLEELGGAESVVPALLSTHPQSAERAKRLESLAKELKVGKPQPLGLDWASVKKSLK